MAKSTVIMNGNLRKLIQKAERDYHALWDDFHVLRRQLGISEPDPKLPEVTEREQISTATLQGRVYAICLERHRPRGREQSEITWNQAKTVLSYTDALLRFDYGRRVSERDPHILVAVRRPYIGGFLEEIHHQNHPVATLLKNSSMEFIDDFANIGGKLETDCSKEIIDFMRQLAKNTKYQ